MLDDTALRILDLLWIRGPSTARSLETHDPKLGAVGLRMNLARLVEVGLVERTPDTGGATYQCRLSRHQARPVLLEELLERTLDQLDASTVTRMLTC